MTLELNNILILNKKRSKSIIENIDAKLKINPALLVKTSKIPTHKDNALPDLKLINLVLAIGNFELPIKLTKENFERLSSYFANKEKLIEQY